MKYFIFIISLVISNLSYSYENNQLLLHNPAKKINFFDLENLDGKKVNIADKLIKKKQNNFSQLLGYVVSTMYQGNPGSIKFRKKI